MGHHPQRGPVRACGRWCASGAVRLARVETRRRRLVCPTCNVAKGHQVVWPEGNRTYQILDPRRHRRTVHNLLVCGELSVIGLVGISEATERHRALAPGNAASNVSPSCSSGWRLLTPYADSVTPRLRHDYSVTGPFLAFARLPLGQATRRAAETITAGAGTALSWVTVTMPGPRAG